MHAAIIDADGKLSFGEHVEPTAEPGYRVIDVKAAGIGPTDLMRAKGLYGATSPPYIPGGEGVGLLDDGRRVYFGHSKAPFGALAPRTLVPESEIWSVPEELSDDQIIALAISGTGALIPLEQAKIAPGENVLILGATGPVGQIAAQVARLLGAGRVVGAARNRSVLQSMQDDGLLDAMAVLGEGDDDAALKAVADGGYDVVLDVIYGPPAEAAMRATRPGARMLSIGVHAGMTVTHSLRDLLFRSHGGVGTGQRSASERHAAFDRLMAMATDNGLKVATNRFSWDDAASAWEAQAGSPHGKIIIVR